MARQNAGGGIVALREASKLLLLSGHQIDLTLSSAGMPESACAHVGENAAFALATEKFNRACWNLELTYGAEGVHASTAATRETVDRDVRAIAAELLKRRTGARAVQKQRRVTTGGVQAKKRRSGGSSACKRCNLIHRRCDGVRNTDASAEQAKCTRCTDADLPCVFG